MGIDMGDISANHNHANILTMRGTAAVTAGVHCAAHPATTVACADLWLMGAPIATPTMTHPTDIVAPHCRLTTSPTGITHATIPWMGASLAPVTLTTLLMEHSQ